MQFITNKSKGGVSFVSQKLIKVYGEVYSDFKSLFKEDVIVTHYDRDFFYVLILRIFLYRCKFIHISHVNPINLSKSKFVFRSLISVLLYKLGNVFGWNFVFISAENYAFWKDYINCELIYNPVLAGLNELPEKHLDSEVRFVNMGRFDYQKNQLAAVNIFAQLIEEYKGLNLKLFFYGDGPYLEEVKARVKELKLSSYIFFNPWVNDVNEVLPNYDVYLQSSRWEGLPTIVIQAQNYGLKILSTPINSSSNLLPITSYYDDNFDLINFLNSEIDYSHLKYFLVSNSVRRHQALIS